MCAPLARTTRGLTSHVQAVVASTAQLAHIQLATNAKLTTPSTMVHVCHNALALPSVSITSMGNHAVHAQSNA